MEKIEIKGRRVFWLIHFIGSLGMAAGGAFIIVIGKNWIIGLANIVFFGGCAVIGLLQFLDGRPRIVIDENGVYDRSWKFGAIAWRDIKEVQMTSVASQKFVSLWLHEPDKVIGKLPAIQKKVVAMNQKMGYGDIGISLAGVSLDPEQIVELCAKLKARSR